MRTHIQILGWLHIALNILCVITGVGIFIACSAAGAATAATGGHDASGVAALLGGIGIFVGGFVALIGLPGTIIGWGLLKEASWARIGGIIISILQLLNFPFGTAIGIYGLWVLFSPEAVAIFESRA